MISSEALFHAPTFIDLRNHGRAAEERRGHTWALVLAAGEGSRLSSMTTTDSGVTIPKQFCSLRGGPSLLQDALRRAASVTRRDRICVVVAAQHAHWWRRELGTLPKANVIVQPENRGTGVGLLLPLLHILERDPHARAVVLPSDHYVRDEPVLTGALARALDALSDAAHDAWRGVVLLGMAPEEADAELGYVVPATGARTELAAVESFVEKPPAPVAQTLIARGALWNSFIIAARAAALAKLIARHDADLVRNMHAAVRRDLRDNAHGAATTQFYCGVPCVDFSRDVAHGREPWLAVLRVPACGWTDLGTPERVAKTLRAQARDAAATTSRRATAQLRLDRPRTPLPSSAAPRDAVRG